MTYFVSGSNHQGEIRGLALTGQDVGVCACELNEAALQELEIYAPGPMQVFVDSGAFSEVTFPGGVPTLSSPISAAEWDKRLGIYERLAATLRTQLYVVAPDAVAHQELTLQRLETYRDRLVSMMRAHRVNVIVPVQKGALSMTDFRHKVEALFGELAPALVWGVPMKKDATTVEELALFAADLPAGARVHLLGLGPKSKAYRAAQGAVLSAAPGVELNSDSVRITALVGRTNGPGGGPRALTAARDEVLAKGIAKGTTAVKHAAVAKVFAQFNREEIQALRRGGWFDEELESAPGVPLEPGCLHYGPGGPFGTDPQWQDA